MPASLPDTCSKLICRIATKRHGVAPYTAEPIRLPPIQCRAALYGFRLYTAEPIRLPPIHRAALYGKEAARLCGRTDYNLLILR